MHGIATFVDAAADYAIGAAFASVIAVPMLIWLVSRDRQFNLRCTWTRFMHAWSVLRRRLIGAPPSRQQAEKVDAGDQVSAGEVCP